MLTRRQFNATASAALLVPGAVATGPARAAAWPTRPVRIIVPFAAGGPTDVIARMVGEQLSKDWGQQVSSRTGQAAVRILPTRWSRTRSLTATRF